MAEKWYHGGPAGLREILPSKDTGALSLALYGSGGVCRRDRVHLTNNLRMAWLYAQAHGGIVYEVEPIGVIEDDPDFTPEGDGIRSVACERARIVGRHKRPEFSKTLWRKAMAIR